MANTRIELVNRIGSRSNTRNTSTKGTKTSKTKINTIGKDRKLKDLDKGLNVANSITSNVRRGSAGLSVGKSFGVGVTFAVIQKGIQLADKLINFHFDMFEAKSGNSLYYSNQRQVLGMATSLGMNYVYGMIKNELVTKKAVTRQNMALDYGRNLYNLNNYGEKYKTR